MPAGGDVTTSRATAIAQASARGELQVMQLLGTARLVHQRHEIAILLEVERLLRMKDGHAGIIGFSD